MSESLRATQLTFAGRTSSLGDHTTMVRGTSECNIMSVDPGRSRKGVTYIPTLSVADCPIDGNNLDVGTHEDDRSARQS